MSLLHEIQDGAVSSAEQVSDLLRRCKLLAVRLGSAELAKWADRELNGYDAKTDTPDYRVIRVNSFAHLVGAFGRRAKHAPVPLSSVPQELRDLVDAAYLMEPIAAYQDLVANKDAHTFQIPWAADLIRILSDKVYEGMFIFSAWQEIPRGAIVGCIDTARNRVLSFALDIEKVNPRAGEVGQGGQPVPQDTLHQVFQTNIYGNVGNIAQASSGASQAVTGGVGVGDFEGLAAKLKSIGLNDRDLGELKSAMESDAKSGKGIGNAIGAWIGKMLGKAGSGALKITVATASEVLPKLIARHLGLSE